MARRAPVFEPVSRLQPVTRDIAVVLGDQVTYAAVQSAIRAADTGGLLLITQVQPIAVIFTLPQDQLQQVKIDLEKAKSEWIQAKQGYLIQESQNESDVATAKVKPRAAAGGRRPSSLMLARRCSA